MVVPANYKQVIAHFKNKPKEIQEYFPSFVKLVEDYAWDVSISYVFPKIEAIKHAVIYCGIVKIHWAESVLTRELVDKEHMSRGRFKELFNTVYGVSINSELLKKLSDAEEVRDKIAHGKKWTDEEARTALIDIFDFAEDFNEFVQVKAGFKPFGDLRGFKGRKESLSKKTTHWVLKGMGIPSK